MTNEKPLAAPRRRSALTVTAEKNEDLDTLDVESSDRAALLLEPSDMDLWAERRHQMFHGLAMRWSGRPQKSLASTRVEKKTSFAIRSRRS